MYSRSEWQRAETAILRSKSFGFRSWDEGVGIVLIWCGWLNSMIWHACMLSGIVWVCVWVAILLDCVP